MEANHPEFLQVFPVTPKKYTFHLFQLTGLITVTRHFSEGERMLDIHYLAS